MLRPFARRPLAAAGRAGPALEARPETPPRLRSPASPLASLVASRSPSRNARLAPASRATTPASRRTSASFPAGPLLLALAALGPAGPVLADTPALEAISPARVAAAVETLAADDMQGRGSGADGGRLAGDWLAAQVAPLGLVPGGADGTWFQPFTAQRVAMRNVIATIPGREPGGSIVIGAHYDHLGLGHQQGSLQPGGRGEIHNGADDNASGTAAVLELARAFAASGMQPRRRLVFAWFDGEERGLLGSQHYVANQPFPEDPPLLMINLDMVGRLGRNKLTLYGQNTGDRLAEWVARANEPVGLELAPRRSMTPNSDHWPFYRKQVPVLMPFTGLHTDYHRPSDDVERVDVEGIVRIARLCLGVAAIAAETDEPLVYKVAPDGAGEALLEQLQAMFGPERWKDELGRLRERFGLGEGADLDQLADRLGRFLRGGERRGEQAQRPRLGVTLDLDEDHEGGEGGAGGLKIRTVARGSIAEQAGLRPGDVVTRMGGHPVQGYEALRWLVANAKGKVELEVIRDGQVVPLVADFGGEAPADGRRWF